MIINISWYSVCKILTQIQGFMFFHSEILSMKNKISHFPQSHPNRYNLGTRGVSYFCLHYIEKHRVVRLQRFHRDLKNARMQYRIPIWWKFRSIFFFARVRFLWWITWKCISGYIKIFWNSDRRTWDSLLDRILQTNGPIPKLLLLFQPSNQSYSVTQSSLTFLPTTTPPISDTHSIKTALFAQWARETCEGPEYGEK